MRRADLAEFTRARPRIAPARESLARAIDRASLPRVLLLLRRAGSPWLTVLTYHRVAGANEPEFLDQGVADCTADQLARHVAFVKRWFDVVTIEDLRAFCAKRASLPRNPVLISFDDGYRDNHDVVLPILLRHGVRATFFVATDYIERRRLYWWDRVSLVIGRSQRDRLELTYPHAENLSLDGPAARAIAIRRVQRAIKDTVGLDLGRFLEHLERAAGVVLPADEERRMADALVMTWEHVLALHRAGMGVESHTHSHRVLQTLGAGEVDRELRQSRCALERVLGVPVRAVSYPVGRSLRQSPDITRAVRAAGYELGFSNGTGVNRIRSFDPYDAKRLSMDRSMPDPFFRAMLALPWLAH